MSLKTFYEAIGVTPTEEDDPVVSLQRDGNGEKDYLGYPGYFKFQGDGKDKEQADQFEIWLKSQTAGYTRGYPDDLDPEDRRFFLDRKTTDKLRVLATKHGLDPRTCYEL